MRIRTASIEIDWKTPQHRGRPGEADLQSARAEFAGAGRHLAADRRGKPLALAAAGALRAGFPVRAHPAGLRAQIGAVQTREIGPYVGHRGCRKPARPAARRPLRFLSQASTKSGGWRLPLGFHASTTHAAGDIDPFQSVSHGLVFQSVEAAWSSPASSIPARTWRISAAARGRALPCIRLWTDLRSRIGQPRRMGTTDDPRAAAAGFPPVHRTAGRRQQPSGNGRDRQESAVWRQRSTSTSRRMCWWALEATQVRTVYHWAGTPHQQPL